MTLEELYEKWGDFIEGRPYGEQPWDYINDVLEIIAMYLAIRTPVKKYRLWCENPFREGWGEPRWLCETHRMQWEKEYTKKKKYGNNRYIAYWYKKEALSVGVCDVCLNNLRYAGGP